MRKRLLIVLAVAVLFVIVLFMPWSPVNCWYWDVDINTGRVRYARRFLFLELSKRVDDSPLSRALPPELVASAGPEWRRFRVHSPGVHYSPSMRFGHASSQIGLLAKLWEAGQFPGDARRRSARHVLAIWKHSDSDYLVYEYLRELGGFEWPDEQQQFLKRLMEVDMPLIEKRGEQVTHTVFYPTGDPLDRFEARVRPDGSLVRHGVHETWHPDGSRSLYDHYRDGQLDGLRFDWSLDGTLLAIARFRCGELVDHESQGLQRHPAHKLAAQLAAQKAERTGPAPARTDSKDPAAKEQANE